jgi:hypothetical protein
VRVMFLDVACGLIADEVLAEGTISQVFIHPRRIATRCRHNNRAQSPCRFVDAYGGGQLVHERSRGGAFNSWDRRA